MTRLSKREQIIRVGGVLMIAAPIFNLLIAVALSSGIPNKWGPSGMMMIFAHNPLINWVLYASSIVVGSMMLKGRRSSWAFVLVVLGLYILYGGLSIYRDVKNGDWQAVAAMLVDCVLFGIIYMQEFHQQVHGFFPAKEAEETVSEPVAAPSPVAEEVSLNLPLPVDLTGLGTWAELVSITEKGFRLKRLSKESPDGLHYRTIELQLPTYPKAMTVQARLFSHNNTEYIFHIVHDTKSNAA